MCFISFSSVVPNWGSMDPEGPTGRFSGVRELFMEKVKPSSTTSKNITEISTDKTKNTKKIRSCNCFHKKFHTVNNENKH